MDKFPATLPAIIITERKVMLKHIAAVDFPLQNTSLDLRLAYGRLTSYS